MLLSFILCAYTKLQVTLTGANEADTGRETERERWRHSTMISRKATEKGLHLNFLLDLKPVSVYCISSTLPLAHTCG